MGVSFKFPEYSLFRHEVTSIDSTTVCMYLLRVFVCRYDVWLAPLLSLLGAFFLIHMNKLTANITFFFYTYFIQSCAVLKGSENNTTIEYVEIFKPYIFNFCLQYFWYSKVCSFVFSTHLNGGDVDEFELLLLELLARAGLAVTITDSDVTEGLSVKENELAQ